MQTLALLCTRCVPGERAHGLPCLTAMEEVCYFQIRPTTSFGFIWTYTASQDAGGFNNVFLVENGDTVLLPKGYHPVVAAPGCQLHYTPGFLPEKSAVTVPGLRIRSTLL